LFHYGNCAILKFLSLWNYQFIYLIYHTEVHLAHCEFSPELPRSDSLIFFTTAFSPDICRVQLGVTSGNQEIFFYTRDITNDWLSHQDKWQKMFLQIKLDLNLQYFARDLFAFSFFNYLLFLCLALSRQSPNSESRLNFRQGTK